MLYYWLLVLVTFFTVTVSERKECNPIESWNLAEWVGALAISLIPLCSIIYLITIIFPHLKKEREIFYNKP